MGRLLSLGAALPPPVVEAPPLPEASVVATVEEAVAVEPAEIPAELAEEDSGWLIPAIVFGVFNLVLLIGGGVWFFVLRKRGSESDELDLDQLIKVQVAAPDSAPGQAREDAA